MLIEKSVMRRAMVNKVVSCRGLEDKWSIFFVEQAENEKVDLSMLANLCKMICALEYEEE